MVRVNLINPKNLADQHLIAEYNEILMLVGYVKKYPQDRTIPQKYCLGKGHIIFFKNKLLYLKKRHELLKIEMKQRGFVNNKTINLMLFPKSFCNDWKPTTKDKAIIKARIIEKFRKKPTYYRYYGKQKKLAFYLNLTKRG